MAGTWDNDHAWQHWLLGPPNPDAGSWEQGPGPSAPRTPPWWERRTKVLAQEVLVREPCGWQQKWNAQALPAVAKGAVVWRGLARWGGPAWTCDHSCCWTSGHSVDVNVTALQGCCEDRPDEVGERLGTVPDPEQALCCGRCSDEVPSRQEGCVQRVKLDWGLYTIHALQITCEREIQRRSQVT